MRSGARVLAVGVAWLLAGCSEPSTPEPVAPASPGSARVPSTARSLAAPGPEPEPRAAELELSFVGDVVLGRYLQHRGEEVFAALHPASADPFAAVAPLLAADVVVGNLESPVVGELPAHPPIAHRNRFAASAAHLAQLQRGGFTVMSLANNHFFDLGIPGQREGPALLAEAGILAIGASRDADPLLRVESVEVRGWRVGFVAAATVRNHRDPSAGPRLPYLSLRELAEQGGALLSEARDDHDLLVVVVHWGTEYADEVRNSNRLAARALLEAGADLVIGHHAHVLQAVERHRSGARDGLIAYSLGNFLFPRNEGAAQSSAVLRLRYREQAPGERPCLEQARLESVHILRQPRWHPEPATGHRAQQVRERLIRLSRAHGTRLRAEWDGDEGLTVVGLTGCPMDPKRVESSGSRAAEL